MEQNAFVKIYLLEVFIFRQFLRLSYVRAKSRELFISTILIHRKRIGNIYSKMLLLLFQDNNSMDMFLPFSVFSFQVFHNWCILEQILDMHGGHILKQQLTFKMQRTSLSQTSLVSLYCYHQHYQLAFFSQRMFLLCPQSYYILDNEKRTQKLH